MQRALTSIDTVAVVAPARLHLGFLDLHGGLGRQFGSLGLAISAPATRLTVARAKVHGATGPEADRARRLLDQLAPGSGRRVAIEEAIPAHAGLGSGTQLALAIGAGLARLDGRTDAAAALGKSSERGARSAIGIAAFERGGFIVDGGRGPERRIPPVIARLDFPSAWRLLLILDGRAKGMHGDDETAAFARLRPFSEALSAHLCRLMIMRLLPALQEESLVEFGAAMQEIQGAVGAHFAPAQGGSPWTSPAVGRLASRLGEHGARGIGQSSWGPTGFAFVADEAEACRLAKVIAAEAKAEGLEIRIVSGRNTGAIVSAAIGQAHHGGADE